RTPSRPSPVSRRSPPAAEPANTTGRAGSGRSGRAARPARGRGRTRVGPRGWSAAGTHGPGMHRGIAGLTVPGLVPVDPRVGEGFADRRGAWALLRPAG